MIAIDTNILARYIAEPDGAEGAFASQLLEDRLSQDDPGFVSAVVVAELLWVLGVRYSVSHDQQRTIVEKLLEMPQLVVEHSDAIEKALASSHRGLADCIIHEIGQAAGCRHTATFDKRFARLNQVELVQ